jgi:hypothetical protein
LSDRYTERVRAVQALLDPELPKAWADGATEQLDVYLRHCLQREPKSRARRSIAALERAVAKRVALSASFLSRERSAQ